MDNMNKEINYSLIDSFERTEISDLSQDLIEIGFDSLLEDGIIKEIPVVKTILASYKTVVTISDKILIKKILLFLKTLNDLPKDTIEDFVAKLNEDNKFKIKVGNKLLLLLEKSDEYEKSYLLAEIFKSYIKEEIDYNTFQLLSKAINNTFIEYIKILKDLYEKLHNSKKVDSEILENLFQSGLVSVESHMVLDSNGLQYKPNNIGSLLIKILFNK